MKLISMKPTAVFALVLNIWCGIYARDIAPPPLVYVPETFAPVPPGHSPIPNIPIISAFTSVEWYAFRQIDFKLAGSSEEVSGRQAAMSKLYEAAVRGNTTAQYILAQFYYAGYLVKKESYSAYYWMEKAAQAGCGDAAYSLATWYEERTGGGSNLRYAAEWFQKSAEMDSKLAQLGGEESFQFSPQGRVADSQLKAGEAYLQGHFGFKSPESAASWFKKASVLGNPRAQNHLAHMYYSGAGVERDEVEAYAYWNLASVSLPEARAKIASLDKVWSQQLRILAQQRTRQLKAELDQAKKELLAKRDLLRKAIEDAERERKMKGA